MLLISIPKPCHENWDEMSPRQQGAFCGVCSKTVVDFTSVSDEEVKNYFLNTTGQKTCGRFRNDQLAEPRTLQELLSRPIPFWKKFLAILCIVFGSFLSSCQNSTLGKIKASGSTSANETMNEYITLGTPMPQEVSDTIIHEIVCPGTIKGDVGIEIIEPPVLVVDGMMPIQSIEEPKEKTDTIFFVGEIEEEVLKKINPVLPKTDSAKKKIKQNDCDTLLRKPIEP